MSIFDPATYQWAKGEKNWHTKYNNALSAIRTFLGVEHNADGTHTASALTPVDFKASGHTPVYISSSSFKIAGLDVSGTYIVGRRLKITLSGGDVYCTVKTVSFSTDTTITTEETTITNTISAVAYGIVSHGSTGSMPKHNHSDDSTGGNLGPVVNALTSKATPVDNDEIPLADSAASFALKKLTWANLKATLKTYFDGIYTTAAAVISYASATFAPLDFGPTISGATSKATPVDADNLALSDSVASNALKKLTFANLKANLPPALSGFSAKRYSAVQTLTPDTWTDVVFETETVDTAGEYNPANGRFTAAVTGTYLFTLSTNISTSGTVAPFGNRLYLNGATVLSWSLHTGSASTSIIACHCSVIVALTAGDYVTGQAYQNAGSNRDLNNGDYTRFSGIRLK